MGVAGKVRYYHYWVLREGLTRGKGRYYVGREFGQPARWSSVRSRGRKWLFEPSSDVRESWAKDLHTAPNRFVRVRSRRKPDLTNAFANERSFIVSDSLRHLD